jgi:hypothetical protein
MPFRTRAFTRTYALAPLLRLIEAGELQASRNTVLVLDEVSQIAPADAEAARAAGAHGHDDQNAG